MNSEMACFNALEQGFSNWGPKGAQRSARRSAKKLQEKLCKNIIIHIYRISFCFLNNSHNNEIMR